MIRLIATLLWNSRGGSGGSWGDYHANRHAVGHKFTQAVHDEGQADEHTTYERQIARSVHDGAPLLGELGGLAEDSSRKASTRRDVRLSHHCDCFDRFCGRAPPPMRIEFQATLAVI